MFYAVCIRSPCRAELGKFPSIIDINKNILNYLNYLREKEESSIVKQSLKISIDLHCNGHNSFTLVS